MFSRKGIKTASLVILAIGLGASRVQTSAAQQSTPPANSLNPVDTAPSQSVAGTASEERYRIGPGDVLEIRIFERPQLSRDAMRVDGSGRIRMPLISDDFVAACQTEFGLAQQIADRYRTYLKNPQVDVFVREFNSEPVAVVGAVNKPGNFQLQRRVRLRELLTFAGGPSLNAGATIQVIHDENNPECDAARGKTVFKNAVLKSEYGSNTSKGQTEEPLDTDAVPVSINLRNLLQGGAGSNPYISPGDFIYIPQAEQVFVVGNVYKPSALALTEPLTVSRAIAMAGGVLPSTKRSKIRIVRSWPDGNREIFVDLERINKSEEPDLTLVAGDIVEVPTSIGKLVLKGFFAGIVPAYAVYAPLTLIH